MNPKYVSDRYLFMIESFTGTVIGDLAPSQYILLDMTLKTCLIFQAVSLAIRLDLGITPMRAGDEARRQSSVFSRYHGSVRWPLCSLIFLMSSLLMRQTEYKRQRFVQFEISLRSSLSYPLVPASVCKSMLTTGRDGRASYYFTGLAN